MRRILFSIMCLLLIAGFAAAGEMEFPQDPTQVTITLDKAEYSPEDEVKVEIRNNSDQSVWVNVCPIIPVIMKKNDSGWDNFNAAPILCRGGTLGLKPHESISRDVKFDSFFSHLGRSIEPGVYKFRASYRTTVPEPTPSRTSEFVIFSNEFTVMAPVEQYSCKDDSECQIVTTYNEPQGVNPGETTISCKEKSRPSKPGESLREYNEYIQGQCQCRDGKCQLDN